MLTEFMFLILVILIIIVYLVYDNLNKKVINVVSTSVSTV